MVEAKYCTVRHRGATVHTFWVGHGRGRTYGSRFSRVRVQGPELLYSRHTVRICVGWDTSGMGRPAVKHLRGVAGRQSQ
jgi:hypothetical protein